MGIAALPRLFRRFLRAAPLLTALLFARPAVAADKTWTNNGGAGNHLASVAANWSPAGVPTNGDHGIFGPTSNQACTWDVSGVTLASVTFTSAYSSTVYLTQNLVTSGDVIAAAGATTVFDLNGKALSIGGNLVADGMTPTSSAYGSSITFTGSNAVTVSKATGNLQFENAVVSKTAGSSVTLTTNLSLLAGFTVLSGTVVVQAVRINLDNDFILNGGYVDVHTSTIAMTGTIPQQISGNGSGAISAMAALYVQNPTSVLLAPISYSVLLDTTPASTIKFAATQTTTANVLTINGQRSATRVNLVSSASGVQAGLIEGANGSVNFASISDLNATGGQLISANFSLNGGNNTNFSIDGVTANLEIWSYGGVNHLASTPGNWAGGVTPATNDYIVFGDSTPTQGCTWDLGIAVDSLKVTSGYAGTVTLASNMFVTGAQVVGVQMDAAAAALNFNGNSIQDSGDWSVGATSVQYSVPGSSVVFVGANPSIIASLVSSPARMPAVVASKNAGQYVKNTTDVWVSSNFVVVSGTYTSTASSRLIVGGDVYLNGGYLDVSVTTVVFSGTASSQTLTGNGAGAVSSFGTLQDQTTAALVIPAISVGVLIATTPSSSLALSSLATPLVVSTLTINGQSGATPVLLRSAVPGSAAQISVANTASVLYSSVTDSNALSPLTANNSFQGGNDTNWTFVGSPFGLTSAGYAGVFITSVAVNWASSFPGGTSYTSQISTDNFATVNASSVTLNLSATFSGLTPSSTYYARVSTGATAAFTSAGSRTTLAATPGTPVFAAVYASSAALTWGVSGNPASVPFLAQASSNAFVTVTASSSVYGGAAVVSGLASNGTYFFEVQAFNSTGIPTAFSASVSTVTPAVPPAVGAGPSISSFTLTAFWAPNGNSTATYYDAQISTDGFATLVDSTRTLTLAATFNFLTPGTTYGFQARALSLKGVPTVFVQLSSATTLLAQPGPAPVPFPGVGASSVTAAWTSGGYPGGTVYVADLSTDNFVTLVYSSSTLNLNATFGSGGAGAPLVANATYYARVSVAGSAFLVIGSTPTLPAPAGNPAAVDVETTSGTWSWTLAGNAPGTAFVAALSTDSFATLVQSTPVVAVSALFQGLAPNTTYQFRVLANGVGGYGSGYAVGGASTTWPSTPFGGGAQSVFVTSTHWSWSDSNAAPIFYAYEASTDAFATVSVASVTAAPQADLVGLVPNTTYYLRARALGARGYSRGALTSGTLPMTLTYPPASPFIVSSTYSVLVASWGINGDPPGVFFAAQISTDAFAANVVSSNTLAASATFFGLAADTTYYLRVHSLNLQGAVSADAAGGSTTTPVALPTAQTFPVVAATDIVAAWGSGGNGPGTLYEAQSTTQSFAGVNVDTFTTALSFDFTGLQVGATYAFRVRAVGRNGTLTSFVALGTTQTLLLTPGVPAQPFTTVGVSSVAAAWTSGGNGAGTAYQADLSTDAFATVTFTSATAALSAVFGTTGAGPVLRSDTLYSVRVRAVQGAFVSPNAVLGSTATWPAAPAAPAVSSATTATLTLSWGAGGNGSTTAYSTQLSTDSFVTLAASSQVAQTYAAYAGLLAAATYQLEVRALGIDGPTPFIALSTWTAAFPPAGPNATDIGISTVIVNWTNLNAAGTPYRVDATSTAFPSVFASTTASGASVYLYGLMGNTTYFMRVRALLPDGTGPDYLPTNPVLTPVAPAAVVTPVVGPTTGTWTWTTTNLNSPSTYFVAIASVSDFSSILQTAAVLASSAPGQAALFSGLTPNTSYWASVQASGWSGAGATVFAPQADTDPAAPAPLPVSGVTSSSFTANWGANGNPPWTLYDARISTDGFATLVASSITFGTQAGFTGLASGQAFAAKVRAVGMARNSPYVALVGTTTLPGSPGAPAQPFLSVQVSSVVVSWTSGGNGPGTVYLADASTDSFATLVYTSATANLSAWFGAGGAGTLTPDTTYQFRVTLQSGGAATPLGSTATLAAVPAAPAASASGTGFLTLSWGAAGNPADVFYEAYVSADNFATILQSSVPVGTSATFSGLLADTTYELRVRAQGRDGRPSAYGVAPATYTAAFPPGAPAATFDAGSSTLSWSTGGNPATTPYRAQISTDSFATLVQSTATFAASAVFSPLLPNTTYQLRVQALGLAGAGAFQVLAASATAAKAPAAPASAALGVSSTSVSWAANGNPAGSVFSADVSTDGFATLIQSSATIGLVAKFSGLPSNATYYQRVSVLQWGGGSSPYAVASATVTPVAPPASAPLVSVGSGSIVAAWSSGGNAPGTYYDFRVSTDAFATVVASVRVSATQGGIGGLSPNTAYALQARAVGNDGTLTPYVALPSTTTYLIPPGPAAVPFPAVGDYGTGFSSITVQWTSNGSPGGTTYRAQISSSGFVAGLATQDATTLYALFTSLPWDTTYQARVYTLNGPTLSQALAVGTTATAAAYPASPAATGNSTGTLTVAWSANGNPPDTQYDAEVSTDFFASLVQAAYLNAPATSFLGLTPNTTYQMRVRAISRAGLPTPYIAAAASSATLAQPPAAPAVVRGVTSVALTWSTAGDPAATLFGAEISTDAFATVSQTASVTGGSWSFNALAPGTTHFARVRALGWAGPTAYAPVLSTGTLVAAPAAPSALALGASSAAFTWSGQGDPVGTLYDAEESTDAFASVNRTSVTINASAVFSGLLSDATHYFRARGEQWDGGFTAYSAIASSAIPAAAPASAPLVSVGTGSVVAAWGAAGNVAGTNYDAGISTDNFATVNSIARTTATQAAFGGLAPNTTYYFGARAVGYDGGVTAFTALPSTMTSLLPPGTAAVPFPLAGVGVSSLTVAWATGGNGPGAVYRAQLSSDAFATVTLSSDTQNLSAAFGTTGLGAPLPPDATYQARVFTVAGLNLSAAVPIGSTGTLAYSPVAPAAAASSTGSLTYAWGGGGNPSDTQYQAQLSTDSFATSVQTASPQTASAGFGGLVPDSTYYLRARAVSRAGYANAYVAAPSTFTPAVQPSAAAASFGVTTALLTWAAGGNPASTVYQAQLSTDNFATVSQSSAPFGTQASFAGLTANTTYQLRVRAAGIAGATPYAAPAASATAAAVPVTPAAAALGVSSVTITWGPNGDPPGTVYDAELSTDAFATLVGSSFTVNAAATFAGLQGNATYYQRARAQQWNGFFTAYAAAPFMVTPVAPPGAGVILAVTSGSITAAWGAGGDAAGTYFDLQISTDGFASVKAAARGPVLQGAFGGLQPNTNYDFRVRALGGDGTLTAFVALPSTTTTLLPPVAAAVPFPGVGGSSVTAAWAAGGNGPGTVYRAEISTDNFATLTLSSTTANLSALFGTGGLGAALPFDTTFYARVFTVNGGLTSTILTIGTTATLSADPLAPAAAASGPASLQYGWGLNGNPADAAFRVELSTDAFATVSQSSAAAGTSAAFAGLVPDTTYFARVQALNRYGAANAFVAAPSTYTQAAVPAAPAAAFGLNSAAMTWSANGNPAATLYLAQVSTDGFATVNQSSAPFGTQAVFSALAANTTYELRARALGLGGPSAFSAVLTSATSAAAPAFPSATPLGATSARISWSANANPSGTVFDAEASTDGFASLVQSSFTLSQSASFFGLQSNGTYYLRVRAQQWNGYFTPYASGAALNTPVAAPASGPIVAVTSGSVIASWGGTNAAGTEFDLQISTDGFATVNAAARVLGTQGGFGGLQSNNNYDFQVRAVGMTGTLTSYVALPSTTTSLLPPGPAAVPYPAVGVSSIAVAWTGGGNGPGATFEADLSTDNFATLNVSSLTANLSARFGTGGAGAALAPDASYYARVFTVNGGRNSAILSVGTTSTLSMDPLSPAASASAPAALSYAWGANGNPPDATYKVQLSSDAFATVAQSSAPAGTAAAFAGLIPDTTYYARVAAINRAGAQNPYAAAPSTFTPAAAPSAPAAAFGPTSAALTWSAGGNPAATVYRAQISTDGFATVNQSSAPFGTQAGFAPLASNTTYQLRVQAVGLSGATAFAVAAASATPAAVPGAPASAALGVSSVTVSWTSAGNGAGTVYDAEASTDAFASVTASSFTPGLSAKFTGLQANATYYQRVRARQWNGYFTAPAAAPAAVTPAASPAAGSIIAVTSGSIAAAWGSGGNSAGTYYDLQLSTDAFATLVAGARGAGTSGGFGGLSPNTPYSLQVRAVGNDGTLTAFTALPSTTTALLPPGPAAVPFPGVGVSSLTAAWTSGGNGAGTTYQAELSTDAFATVSVSSLTANLTARFGTGGAGPALAPDAVYSARVFTVGGGNSSVFMTIGSTGTQANIPAGTALVAVTSQTVTLSWSGNGNPAGAAYELQISAAPAFTAPTTLAVTGTAGLAAGLSSGATYYFRVRALSPAGNPTGYDAAVSTATLPPAPTQPGQPVAASLGVSSISWTWSASAFAAGYDLYKDTAAAQLLNAQSSATFVESSLGPNTSAYLLAVGFNGSGQGPRSAPGLGWTLANPPAGSAASSVWATSAAVSWGLNGNSGGTGAEVQRSPDGVAYAAVGATIPAVAYTDAGLLGCTTYYYRVRNVNGQGVFTAFDSVVSFRTAASTPLAPTGLAVAPLSGSRLQLSWTASPSVDVKSYNLYFDSGTGVINYASAYASFSSTVSSFVTMPLASSSSYAFGLRAVNNCGTEEKNVTTRASSPAAAALAAVRAAVSSPPDGHRVWGNRVTVSAGLTAGQLASLAQVKFQYRLMGAASWTDMTAAAPAAHPNPAPAAPPFIQWDVTALALGAYDVRGVAYDVLGSSDGAPTTTTIAVDSLTPDMTETDLGGGVSQRTQTVYSNLDNDVVTGGESAGAPLARLLLPAGALSGSTAAITVISNPDLTGISTSAVGGRSAGLFASVTLSNGQTALSGGRMAGLTLSYPDANNDGVVDGTGLTASNLACFSYSALSGWQKDLTTTFDPAARTVTCQTPHFSVFGVFSAPSNTGTLEQVRAYPVPFKPNGTNPDEGRPYNPGDPNSGIVFDGLPATVRIQIYAIDGRLVADLNGTGNGTLQWDARNGAGRDVATGGYFAVVSSPGLKTVIRRLSIIR